MALLGMESKTETGREIEGMKGKYEYSCLTWQVRQTYVEAIDESPPVTEEKKWGAAGQALGGSDR